MEICFVIIIIFCMICMPNVVLEHYLAFLNYFSYLKKLLKKRSEPKNSQI